MSVPPAWLNLDVSRETMNDLTSFVSLVEKWNPRINLVSKMSVADIWDRHIWDAVQIAEIVKFEEKWLDIGSGGGFPGIVLSILAKQLSPKTIFTLIESDQRKCAFLRTAVRELGLNVNIISERIEAATPQKSDVMSARALADLSALLQFAQYHLLPTGLCVFPKGQTWVKEITSAQENWSFTYEAHKSETNPDAAILTIKDIRRA